MATPKPTCIVVGAGIIGLTTAICLLENSYHVVCLASHLPDDPLSAEYSSTAAGAHHLSFAADGDERQQWVDKRTFNVMMDEIEREGDQSHLMRIKQVEFYGKGAGKHIKFFEQLPDVSVLMLILGWVYAYDAALCLFSSRFFLIQPQSQVLSKPNMLSLSLP